jgi:uncharacterized protein (TIRG00374 family)
MVNILGKYKRPLFSGIIIGLAVAVALLIAGDLQGVIRAVLSFNLRFLVLILILAPLNYIFRYIKWNYYLKLTGLQVEPKMNRLIFVSGLAMTISPGKIGELLKCYLLKEHMGAPISTTSSIVMAERLTDGLAMVILASFGCLSYAYGVYVLVTVAVILVSAVILFQYDGLFSYFCSFLGRIGFLRRFSFFLLHFQQNAKRLFTLQGLFFAVGIGVISWGFEGLVIFFTVRGFGGDISVLSSVFVVSFSSLVGALSVIPGGLVVAEGSIMALLLLAGLGREMAAATTLVTRFSTLWLGVLIGFIGLYLVQKELFRKGEQKE